MYCLKCFFCWKFRETSTLDGLHPRNSLEFWGYLVIVELILVVVHVSLWLFLVCRKDLWLAYLLFETHLHLFGRHWLLFLFSRFDSFFKKLINDPLVSFWGEDRQLDRVVEVRGAPLLIQFKLLLFLLFVLHECCLNRDSLKKVSWWYLISSILISFQIFQELLLMITKVLEKILINIFLVYIPEQQIIIKTGHIWKGG